MPYDGNKRVNQLNPVVVDDDTLFVVANDDNAGAAKRSDLGLLSQADLDLFIEDYYTSAEVDALLGDKEDSLGFTPENVANKSTDTALGSSDTAYPSQKAVKTYVDSKVAGLLDYRGAFDASVNSFPTTGGSGTAGAIAKGDLFIVSVAGSLGGTPVQIGDSLIANVDAPGQTASSWDILNSNVSYVPENAANKENTTIDTSTTKYPTVNLLKQGLDTKVNTSALGDLAYEDSVGFGGITGNVADNSALQTALNLKADLSLLDDYSTTDAFADVAFSGLYSDLTGAPSIPSEYTNEMAQDAVGGIFSAEFTYDDNAPSISVNAIASSKITGTKTSAFVSDFNEAAQDAVGLMINDSLSYNDSAPSLGINYSRVNVWAGLQTFSVAPAFSTMTPGSVPFFGASGVVSQDSAGFYFDDEFNRLSVYSTTGGELITNGSFASGSVWSFGSGWVLSGGTAAKTSNGLSTLSQSLTVQLRREYRLRYTVKNYVSGTVTPSVGGFTCPTVSAAGTYECRFVATSNTSLAFTPSNTARLAIDDVSLVTFTGVNTRSNIHAGGLTLDGNWGNGNPGTTRAVTINNDGQHTWLDFLFAGNLRSTIGTDSSGQMNLYASGGSYFGFYSGNSGLTSNMLFAYLYPTAFIHNSGFGGFQSGVHAGATSTPHTVLQSAGAFASAYAFKFTNFTAGNEAATYYCDASSPTCVGTPSQPNCSAYTASGEATCESHLPCNWYAGSDCSAFNGDQSACQGQSGCNYDTAGCSGTGAYDQSSCESYSGCSWSNNPLDCSGFGDQYTCESYSCSWSNNPQDCSGFSEMDCTPSGCSANYDYCSNYYDESSCYSADASCSWDGSTCSGGSWFTSCSGSYDSYSCTGTYDNYSCTGTYYTGSCSGTYGAACQGTVSCSAYDSEGACEAEAGCDWLTAITATLPSAATCLGRIYTFYNASASGADLNIVPTGSDTINLTTSYLIGDYKGKATFQAARDARDCSTLSEGACAAQTGCTPYNNQCTWNSEYSNCEGGGSCSSQTDQSMCEATSYFAACLGTYSARIGWFLVGV